MILNKCRSKFDYTVHDTHIYIEDLANEFGTMSVTNDCENVINFIASKIGADIKNKRIIYQDTDHAIDEIVPIWEGDNCIDVEFKPFNHDLQTI